MGVSTFLVGCLPTYDAGRPAGARPAGGPPAPAGPLGRRRAGGRQLDVLRARPRRPARLLHQLHAQRHPGRPGARARRLPAARRRAVRGPAARPGAGGSRSGSAPSWSWSGFVIRRTLDETPEFQAEADRHDESAGPARRAVPRPLARRAAGLLRRVHRDREHDVPGLRAQLRDLRRLRHRLQLDHHAVARDRRQHRRDLHDPVLGPAVGPGRPQAGLRHRRRRQRRPGDRVPRRRSPAATCPLVVLTGVLLAGVVYSMPNAVWPATYAEYFPTRVRLSGMAIGTQFGFALAGFTPDHRRCADGRRRPTTGTGSRCSPPAPAPSPRSPCSPARAARTGVPTRRGRESRPTADAAVRCACRVAPPPLSAGDRAPAADGSRSCSASSARASAPRSPRRCRSGRAASRGCRSSYRLIDVDELGLGVDDLPDVLAWAQRLGFDGLNVTHPFKQAVVPLLDELSDDAADLGAVNTVVFRDGRMLGPQHGLVGLRPGVPRRAARRRAGPGRPGRCRRCRASRWATGCCEQGAEHVAVLDADRERADACAVRLAKRFGDDRVAAGPRPGRGTRRRAGTRERDPDRDARPSRAWPSRADLVRDGPVGLATSSTSRSRPS